MYPFHIQPSLSETSFNEAETGIRREGVPVGYGDERHACCRPLRLDEAEGRV